MPTIYCTRCDTHRPDFSFPDPRPVRCNRCLKNMASKRRKARVTPVIRSRRKAAQQLTRDLQTKDTAQSVLSVVESIAASAGITVPKLCADVGDLYNHPDTSSEMRRKIGTTALHALITVEQHVPVVDPLDVIAELHAKRQLVPLLREMMETGELSYDDFDPISG